MNDDYGTTLTALLDDVADTIHPRADFESVRAGHVTLVAHGGPAGAPHGPGRFRRQAAIAAAAVVLVGGGVAAYQGATDDSGSLATADNGSTPAPTTSVVTSTTAVPSTSAPVADGPTEPDASGAIDASEPAVIVERTAEAGGVDVSTGIAIAKFRGTAPAGETVRVSTPFASGEVAASSSGQWYVFLQLPGATAGASTATVTFTGAADTISVPFEVPAAPVTVPKASTTTLAPVTTTKPAADPAGQPPAVTEFNATLGWSEGDGTPLEIGLWGKGAPGSVVSAASSAGSGSTTVRTDGTWEMVVRLDGLAPGAKAGIRVTNSASVKVFEFTAKAPVTETPVDKPFTASLGAADFSIEPAKQMIVGTGTPGSVVRAESPYGVGEAVVGSGGGYELKLKIAGAPAGTAVGIRVTNTASATVFEFEVVRQAPPVIAFSANAAFNECDSTPPFNEYWGKAAVGATVTISSPYGSGQVVAGADGKWDARIEFPDAPVGQFFDVVVSSSQGGSFTFPMVRVAPA